MGLCKCPKRKVTNQFCYEHRVNVCEYCMVTNHPKCIVQSYLQWLQDSDYNPTCELCRKDLAAENCIRLTCYHVYHWACLNHFARQLPSTTAPAGYKCPQCNACLFPPSNLVSPVADVLREKLSSVNWAREGLGLPLLSEEIETKPTSVSSASKSFVHTYKQPVEPATYSADVYSSSTGRRYQSVDIEESTPLHHNHPITTGRDHDDNKYKRRSLLEWFTRWWMSTYPSRRSLHPTRQHLYRRYVTLAVILIIGLITLIFVFNQLGHFATDGDPNLDPLANPNIHVQNIARE